MKWRERGGEGGDCRNQNKTVQCSVLVSCQFEGHVETDLITKFSSDKKILHCKYHNCFNHNNVCTSLHLRNLSSFGEQWILTVHFLD